MKEASKRWGDLNASKMRENLEKTAEAVDLVESYQLEPSDDLKTSKP